MVRTLREMEIPQKLYTRNDPDSRSAYFEIEEPNVHLNVSASVDNLQFIWDRYKSNENLNEHLFTHYLTRHLYSEDEYRVLNGQKVGKDIVSIKTDDGNEGLLCSSEINIFTKIDKDDEELPDTLDKRDLPAMTEHMKEKWDKIKYIQTEVWNEIIDELVEKSVIAVDEFTKLIKAKTMPQWQ